MGVLIEISVFLTAMLVILTPVFPIIFWNIQIFLMNGRISSAYFLMQQKNWENRPF